MTSETIKERLRATLFSAPLPEISVQRAAQFAADLRPDGTWGDLEGLDPFADRGDGVPEHLQRALLLARASRDDADALSRALDGWLATDYESFDWRQNQLVVPRLVGSVALRLDERLSPGARGKVMEVLARARWHHWSPPTGWSEWKGTTLLRIAYNVLLRGCVCDAPTMFEEAFKRVFGSIRIAGSNEEGIQPDMIYRSFDGSSTEDASGLAFVTNCAEFITLAHGTPWQAPVEAVKLLTAFLLDGQQWLMRNGVLDTNFPQNNSPRSPVDLKESAAAVDRLAQLSDTPSRTELAALARRLAGQSGALSGHRHFWRSGFGVHQRPGFYSSICLPSAGIGTTRVMRSGHEYDGIDFAGAEGLPGTTFFRASGTPAGDAASGEEPPIAGGVSEGDYGLAAMHMSRPRYSVTKAWFYFDNSFVCLGAGLTASGSNQPAVTLVNQCRLNGSVVGAVDRAQPRTLAPGTEHALPMIRRVAHDGITYHFLKPSRVAVQTGGSAESFALSLNHGLNPNEESYGYIVLPIGDDAAAKAKIDEEISQIEVLANTTAIQVVRHQGLRLVCAVFWRGGVVSVPGSGRAAANQPCLLICREGPSIGKRLTIANLRREPTTVHVEFAGKCVAFELPGGPDAQRGISRSL